MIELAATYVAALALALVVQYFTTVEDARRYVLVSALMFVVTFCGTALAMEVLVA